MKSNIVLGMLSIMVAGMTYASYPQKITACVNVKTNTSNHQFSVGYGSTDFFDRGTYSSPIFIGETCASGTYASGPKSISLGVGDRSKYNNLLIKNDASCRDYYNWASGWVSSPYFATDTPTITWRFTITQAEPEGSYKAVYNMSCEWING